MGRKAASARKRGREVSSADGTSGAVDPRGLLLLPAVGAVLVAAAVAALFLPQERPPAPYGVTTAEISREYAAHVLDDSPSARAAQARALLQELVKDGSVLHTPVRVIEHVSSGLGIYAARKLVRGQPIFTLPTRHMIQPVDDGIGVASVLLKELRQPSSKIMQLYTTSLPQACPSNIAARSRTSSDLALVAMSLHAWKVELVRAEQGFLRREFGSDAEAASASEAEWATCMFLSRALGQDDPQVNTVAGLAASMVPFVDLLKCEPILHKSGVERIPG